MDRPPRGPPGPRSDRRLRLRLDPPPRPVAIIGHRGARGLFAENTLQGFIRTAAMGVDAIELDVGLSADGVVMVHHDRCLNPALTREPDGRYLRPPGPALTSLTAAALARYDVGRVDPAHRVALAHPAQQPIDGARIPTLAAVLGALPETRFVVELKSDPTAADGAAWPDPIRLAEATALVCDAADSRRVVLQSFDWRGLRHLRQCRPDLALAWLTMVASKTAARAVAAESGRCWAPAHARLTAATLRHARALGLRVLPWTVNRPTRMRTLIAAGVDGLITDRPDLAQAVLGRGKPGALPLDPAGAGGPGPAFFS